MNGWTKQDLRYLPQAHRDGFMEGKRGEFYARNPYPSNSPFWLPFHRGMMRGLKHLRGGDCD